MNKINMSELAKKTASERNENWIDYMDTYRKISKDTILEQDSKGFDLIQSVTNNNEHRGKD